MENQLQCVGRLFFRKPQDSFEFVRLFNFGGGTVKKLYIQVSDFQVWRDFRFQTGGRNKRHHKGLLAFLNKLGIPFLSLYLIPLCKLFKVCPDINI